LIYALPYIIFSSANRKGFRNPYTFTHHKKKNIAYVNGFPFAKQEDLLTQQVLLELPWIKNAYIEDYIELQNKYTTEYQRFQIKMDELLCKVKNGEPLDTNFLKEYNEASFEIG